jgi:hypothetical protein
MAHCNYLTGYVGLRQRGKCRIVCIYRNAGYNKLKNPDAHPHIVKTRHG